MTEQTRESLGLPFAAAHGEEANLRWIENSVGQTVCDFYCVTGPEQFHRFQDADRLQEFIVTACNSHHDLVEAIWVLMRAHAREIGVPLDEAVGGPFEVARDALAKAKGGAS